MRVTSEKVRQSILTVGTSLEPGIAPERIELFDADGNPIDLRAATDGTRLPAGGLGGQILAKLTSSDYSVGWVDPPEGGGDGGGGDSSSGIVLNDEFETGALNAYDLNDAGLDIGDGLIAVTTGDHRILHETLLSADFRATLTVVPGGDTPGADILFRGQDFDNFLMAQLFVSSGVYRLQIGKFDSGSGAGLTSGSVGVVPSEGVPMHTVVRVAGGAIVLEAYDLNPRLGGQPIAFISYKLSGGDLTKFGTSGRMGIRIASDSTEQYVDQFTVVELVENGVF